MRCEDAIERIQTAAQPGAELRAAFEHAAGCDECGAALQAVNALRALRDEPLPPVDDRAVQRAIDRALANEPANRWRRGFFSGAATGAALAAAIGAVAFGLWLGVPGGGAGSGAVPEVRLALNQPQPVTVTLDAPEALLGAAVRVELRGAVELQGYEGQRELRWSTDLDRGINRLTLPVVALGAGGGQVLVEVEHGEKRRTFLLDVRAGAAG